MREFLDTRGLLVFTLLCCVAAMVLLARVSRAGARPHSSRGGWSPQGPGPFDALARHSRCLGPSHVG